MPGPCRHIEFLLGKPLPLGPFIAEPRRQGQPELAFQFLGGDDDPPGLPLPKPDRPVQPDPRPPNVEVVVVGVPMPHKEVLVLVRVHADLGEQRPTDLLPPVRGQLFAGRQGQGAVPDRPGDIRPQLPGHAKLPRQLTGRAPRHIAADQGRT